MNLKDLRQEWESDCTVVVAIPIQIGTFVKLLVITHSNGAYSLLRYFKIGNNWSVSADVSNKDLMDCQERITDDPDYRDMMDAVTAS